MRAIKRSRRKQSVERDGQVNENNNLKGSKMRNLGKEIYQKIREIQTPNKKSMIQGMCTIINKE